MKKAPLLAALSFLVYATTLAQDWPLEPCNGFPDYQRHTGSWKTYCPADERADLAKHGYSHCLRPGRTFSVKFATWALGVGALERGQRAGKPGAGWHTETTIAYWLYSPDNVEALVKVLDGRDVNGHWWLDFVPLTDQYDRLVVGPTCQTLLDNDWLEDWWVIESGPAGQLGITDYTLADGSPNPMADRCPRGLADRVPPLIGIEPPRCRSSWTR